MAQFCFDTVEEAKAACNTPRVRVYTITTKDGKVTYVAATNRETAFARWGEERAEVSVSANGGGKGGRPAKGPSLKKRYEEKLAEALAAPPEQAPAKLEEVKSLKAQLDALAAEKAAAKAAEQVPAPPAP